MPGSCQYTFYESNKSNVFHHSFLKGTQQQQQAKRRRISLNNNSEENNKKNQDNKNNGEEDKKGDSNDSLKKNLQKSSIFQGKSFYFAGEFDVTRVHILQLIYNNGGVYGKHLNDKVCVLLYRSAIFFIFLIFLWGFFFLSLLLL